MEPPEYPIKVGSMLYTLVDPTVGFEVEYNRWYERDHYYGGCMVGPWLFAGSRWVATRELKELRFPKDESNAISQPYDRGSYVAIYWVHEGHHDDHFGWASKQVHELYAAGRGFHERRHAHTVLYWYLGTEYRDDDPVPIELALDHRYAGLMSIAVDRADGVADDDLVAWLAGEGARVLMDGSAVASISSWRPIERDDMTSNAPMDLGSPTGGAERVMQLAFCDGDVRDSWDRAVAYSEALASAGLGTVVAAAPFHPTIIGTDTYTDQLW